MKIKLKFLFIMSTFVLFMALTSCMPFTSKAEDETTDAAQIYATVIRQVYTVDDTQSGTLQAPIVYLNTHTDDRIGDPSIDQLPSEPIGEVTQQAIVAQLADLPAEWHWVESRADVPFIVAQDEVPENIVLITLGNIQPQEDGTVQVSSSIHFAFMAGSGQTYILEQVDGKWVINGTTGAGWFS